MRKIKIGKVVLTDGGVWNATTGYPILTFVRHNGDGWWSFKANVNSEPSAGNPNWIQATDTQSLQEAMREAIADVEALDRAMQEAESIRTSAEEERNEAENKRNEAEHGRMDAESLRDRNEDLRKSGESTREAAERRRDAEESARIMAERGRAAAETARETASAAAIEQANQAVGIANAAAQVAQGSAEYAKEQGDYAKMEGGKIAPAIAQMNETFERNEAQREQRVQTAVDGANTAADNANRAMENIEAPKDGKIYGRKNGGWVEAADEHLAEMVKTNSKHLGVYTRVSTLPLTANYATGKMLTTLADGKTVVLTDMPGWGVTRIFPLSEEHPEGFTFGDTAFLPMLSAEGENLMQVGAVVFASELVRTDEKGQVVYTELRSLYRAQTKDICEWGGLLKDISLRGRQLLVSHPLSVTLMDIGRSGRGASAATTEANIMDAMDEKANFAGRFPFFVAGQATALEKTEAGVEDLAERLTARPVGFAPDLMHDFGSLDTRGAWDDADDLYLSVKKVTGDVVGGNQMLKDPTMSNRNNFTIADRSSVLTIEDGVATIEANGGSSWQNGFQSLGCPSPTIGHKKMYYCEILADRAYSLICSYGGDSSLTSNKANEWTFVSTIATMTRADSSMNIYAMQGFNASPFVKIKSQVLLDLTHLFPTDPDFVTSLTQSDSLKVIHRMAIFAFEHDLPDDYPI